MVTEDGKVGFDDPAAARTLGKLRQLYAEKSLLLGAPRLVGSGRVHPGADRHAVVRAVGAAAGEEGAGGRLRGAAVPPGRRDGAPAVPVGAYGAAVSARARHKELAKAYVKWLWVERTDYQEDFALPTASTSRPGSRWPEGGQAAAGRGGRGGALRHRPRPRRAAAVDPGEQTAYQDALSRIIKGGADPDGELRSVVRKTEAELRRVQKKN